MMELLFLHIVPITGLIGFGLAGIATGYHFVRKAVEPSLTQRRKNKKLELAMGLLKEANTCALPQDISARIDNLLQDYPLSIGR